MDKENSYRSPIAPVFEKLSKQKEISLVYGDPVELGDRKVIPVAKVNYFIGGGGGSSDGTESVQAGRGEGGGGHVSIKPLGVYEMSRQHTTFKPVYNVQRLSMVAAVVSGILIWSLKKLTRSFKRKV
ncbi:spore germination protein GerW family protein [Halobacillus naozhouensis]|uniref:Spore germination protein GerW family protein n=1 Tax=Halobacillus naozhouensis TaxID=554880 RepID=A0ABY8IX86_9BACI|nr:spore germination protein GerW family protein [Halobacillus naozhouensis]WFT74848.1 spore germination protein GerW family protein [Halobacillus naozhouensis]